jgi:hypothetical protein
MGRNIIHAGLTWRLESYEKLAGSPVEAPAYSHAGQLVADGFAPMVSIYWDHKAVALIPQHSAQVAAAIVYRLDEVRPIAFVTLGFTVASYRRLGLYKVLFGEFAAALCGRGLTAIESGYHVDNAASAAMHARLGRAVTHHLTTFPLMPAERPDGA